MTLPLFVADGCEVITITERVHHDGVHWREHVQAEIHGGPACLKAEIYLPEGSWIRSFTGQITRNKLPNSRIGPERLQTHAQADGTTLLTVRLDAFDPSDTIKLHFERDSGLPATFVWQPGLTHTHFAQILLPLKPYVASHNVHLRHRHAWVANPTPQSELQLRHPWAEVDPTPVILPTKSQDLSPQDALTQLSDLYLVDRGALGASPVYGEALFDFGLADDRGIARTLIALTAHGPTPTVLARLHPDDPTTFEREVAVIVDSDGAIIPVIPAALPLPAGELSVQGQSTHFAGQEGVPFTPAPFSTDLKVVLDVYGRDVLRAVHRKKRTWTEQATLQWSGDAEGPKVALVALTPDVRKVRADCDRIHETRYAVSLVAAPGTTSCEIQLTHELTAPWGAFSSAWSHVTPSLLQARWHRSAHEVLDGELVHDSAGWRLSSLGGVPFLDGAPALANRLDIHWRQASIPEPGHPLQGLRGKLTWADIPDIIALARGPVIVDDALTVPVDRPRPLLRARRSVSVTRPELAMLLTLYLRQHRLDADWYLVAPRRRDTPAEGSPLDFTDAVVRLRIDDAEAWIAPACRSCLSFELPPDLAGAWAVGPSGTARLPEPDLGAHPSIGPDGRVYREDGALVQGAFASQLRIDEGGALWKLGAGLAILARQGAAPWPEDAAISGLQSAEGPVKIALEDARPLALGLPAPHNPGVYERVRPTPGQPDRLTTCGEDDGRWSLTIQTKDAKTAERLVIRTRDFGEADTLAVEACLKPPSVGEGEVPDRLGDHADERAADETDADEAAL